MLVAVLASGCSTAAESPHQVSGSAVGAFEAALTATGDGGIVAWYDTRDGNGEIYVRHVDATGHPDEPERRLTRDAEDSYEPSIAAVGNSLALAWYDKASNGTLTARLGLWNRDGTQRWVTTIASPARNPVLCVDRQDIVVSWIQRSADGGEAVWLARWGVDGMIIAAPRRLGPAHSTTWNLNVATDGDSSTWVVWDALSSTRASELFVARAGASTATLTRLTADDGRESKYPDIALRDGHVALTWFDAKDGNTEVYLVLAGAADLAPEIDHRAQRITTTAGESIGAYVAWNGERLGLAWSDDNDGQHEVYFQAFDPRGRALAPPSRVTTNEMSSLVPAIEPWADRFALAWNEFIPGESGHSGTSAIAFAIPSP